MDERSQLLGSIAGTIDDYRAGELAKPTPAHVDRWINQFSLANQLPLLREIDHVLKDTYYSRNTISQFLAGLVVSSTLAGTEPCVFWKSANFLQIQQHGESQQALLEIFDQCLREHCGFGVDVCGSPAGPYIYLDDILFSGNRIGNDLEPWIANEAPSVATVHVIVMEVHTLGEYHAKKRLKAAATKANKSIDIQYWRADTVENRLTQKDNSQVLWPALLPQNANLAAYMAQQTKFPFVPRIAGGKPKPFSSETGRQLLECELLLAGVNILSWCRNPKEVMRPLGFSSFGLGFGSMTVTFRNCPNNCPLALWWGDPTQHAGNPLSRWYPLVPRKTY